MKLMTIDLALANTGIIIWDNDKIIYNEAFKTSKTDKKTIQKTRKDLKYLKKIKENDDSICLKFKRVNNIPVKSVFSSKNRISNRMIYIEYKSKKDNEMKKRIYTFKEFIKYYEQILNCKSVALDRVRRIEELVERLINIISKYNIKYVITELPSGTQSAIASNLMGNAVGLFVATMKILKINVTYVTQHQVKIATCNNRKADKHEMMAKVKELYPDGNFPSQLYKFEHIADAIGVKLAYDKFILTK